MFLKPSAEIFLICEDYRLLHIFTSVIFNAWPNDLAHNAKTNPPAPELTSGASAPRWHPVGLSAGLCDILTLLQDADASVASNETAFPGCRTCSVLPQCPSFVHLAFSRWSGAQCD